MKVAAKDASGHSTQEHGKGRAVDNNDADDGFIVAELYLAHRKPLEM